MSLEGLHVSAVAKTFFNGTARFAFIVADIFQSIVDIDIGVMRFIGIIFTASIKDGALALTIVDGTENEGAPYGFAVFSEDKQELIDKFNAGLANIKENGTYDEILAKYLDADAEAEAETEAETAAE